MNNSTAVILALAIAALVLTVAAHSQEGDYELVLPGEVICAKSYSTCLVAQKAIARGLWPIVPAATQTLCLPHPDCFSPRSNCIIGYNCAAGVQDGDR